MRVYRKTAGGPFYADTTHPETGKRWQFATGEHNEMSARAKAEDRIAKMRAALGGGSGTTTGLTPTHGGQAPSAPATVPLPAPSAAPPNKLAAALASMRAGAAGTTGNGSPGNPAASAAPSPATTKLAAIVGRKGTPVVVGAGEELVRRGFFVLEGREPQELDSDEEDELGEALGGWLATILPDSAVGPGSALLIIFALTFMFAWLRGKPIKKDEQPKDGPPRPQLVT